MSDVLDVPLSSDMRRALCGLICKTVWRGSTDDKRRLAAALEVVGFEEMSTAAITMMAETYCAEADVMRLLHMCDETAYELTSTYLCANCLDEAVVVDDNGRWHRCFQCNPYEPVEPKAGKK